MTEHQSTTLRKQQIVAAMLDLLATTPVEAITTRQIAGALGLTQPALFRHFRTRDDVILAVLAQARADLAWLARDVLTSARPALERIALLIEGLFAHIERHPGLPRLLFRDVAQGEPARTRAPIEALVAMQRTLVAELVRAGQQEGQVPPQVDAEGAARLLVALVQGVLLQWQLAGRPARLVGKASELMAFWRAGLEAGRPLATALPLVPDVPGPVLAGLDVRPILAEGVDPLAAILAAVDRLPPTGVLLVTAPFRPTPLLALLAGRGFHVLALEVAPDRWQVEVRTPDAPEPLDLRDLPAPEPLERVLERTATLAPGAVLLVRVPRVPHLLLPHLTARGLHHAVHEEADGSALLHVRRPA